MAKRILVVDDDVDFREATELILSGAGYDVSQASNSQEAINTLRGEQIDLVLLDVMMESDTEGFHLAYQMREDDELKDVPIVMLTCIEESSGVQLDPEKSQEYLPVEAYLRKPLDADLLKTTIAGLVG